MAEQNIKDVIKQEFLKCASDPVYFMKKYYWIQHPQRGRIQFGLYPFQEKVLHLFKTNSYNDFLNKHIILIKDFIKLVFNIKNQDIYNTVNDSSYEKYDELRHEWRFNRNVNR